MTDEQKQKRRDYQREFYKKYDTAKKLNNKIIDDSDNDNKNIKLLMIVIKLLMIVKIIMKLLMIVIMKMIFITSQ